MYHLCNMLESVRFFQTCVGKNLRVSAFNLVLMTYYLFIFHVFIVLLSTIMRLWYGFNYDIVLFV